VVKQMPPMALHYFRMRGKRHMCPSPSSFDLYLLGERCFSSVLKVLVVREMKASPLDWIHPRGVGWGRVPLLIISFHRHHLYADGYL
jgi:hypothetical protein